MLYRDRMLHAFGRELRRALHEPSATEGIADADLAVQVSRAVAALPDNGDTADFIGAWADDADGPWTLSSIDPTSGVDDGDVVVELPGGGGEPNAVFVAVLVYLEGAPDGLPGQAPKLRAFEPDVVFLNPDVEVAPSSPE